MNKDKIFNCIIVLTFILTIFNTAINLKPTNSNNVSSINPEIEDMLLSFVEANTSFHDKEFYKESYLL